MCMLRLMLEEIRHVHIPTQEEWESIMPNRTGYPQEIRIENDPAKPGWYRVIILWGLMDTEEYAGGRFVKKAEAREYIAKRFPDMPKSVPIL